MTFAQTSPQPGNTSPPQQKDASIIKDTDIFMKEWKNLKMQDSLSKFEILALHLKLWEAAQLE